MPMLTLFTTPKPFTNPHIDMIQRNALCAWRSLGEDVRVVMIGDEQGMPEVAREYSLEHLRAVRTNALGTPLVSSIFELGRSFTDSSYLAYVNADIIFFPEVLTAVRQVGSALEHFLMVGQRWDLDVQQRLSFEGNWADALRADTRTRGTLHVRAGSDYFIFPRACFTSIPDFSIGRAGWDNWMIYHARTQGWPVVDCTPSLDIIHQNHDYSHLPNAQPHYRLPETGENIRLAGGRRTIFTLDDATHQLKNGQIEPMPRTWSSFWRSVETYPLLKHQNYALTQLLFTLAHPKKAAKERARQREMDLAMAQSKQANGGA